jgi:hypothetical protein
MIHYAWYLVLWYNSRNICSFVQWRLAFIYCLNFFLSREAYIFEMLLIRATYLRTEGTHFLHDSLGALVLVKKSMNKSRLLNHYYRILLCYRLISHLWYRHARSIPFKCYEK